MSLKKIKQNTVIVMAVIIVSKLIGMLRDVVLANYYGTSNISDAYLIAASIPTALFYFVAHSMSTAFLPVYNKVVVRSGEKEALKYMNNLLCVALVICAILVTLLLIFPHIVVKLFAAGFDAETTTLAVRMIRICASGLFFMAIINIWSGYLHAKNNFVLPAAISLPRNAAIISSIVISASFGVDFLAIGMLVAYIFELLFLLPSVFKNGYRPRLYINLKSQEMKETMSMVVPVLIGATVGQVNKIIDRSLASTIVVGGISGLSYAAIINSAVQEILVTGIITILFANCSKLVAQEKHDEVKKKLSKTINIMQALLIPASAGVIILAEPIVKLILMRGSFDENSLVLTTGSLRCYTVGLLFLAMRDTMVKVFYAYKDTKITTITSICAILINIILNLILSKFMGVSGLALATSISAIVNCIALYALLSRKIGVFGIKGMFINITKVIFSTSMMAVLVYFAYHVWLVRINELLRLFVCSAIGVVVYFCIAILLKVFKLRKIIKK